MSRGARKGNSALVKPDSPLGDSSRGLAEKMMSWNAPIAVVNIVHEVGLVSGEVLKDATMFAVRHEHSDLAEYFMEREDKAGSGMFNVLCRYHYKALTPEGDKLWKDKTVKSTSVLKSGPGGMTPLHCACANQTSGHLRSSSTSAHT